MYNIFFFFYTVIGDSRLSMFSLQWFTSQHILQFQHVDVWTSLHRCIHILLKHLSLCLVVICGVTFEKNNIYNTFLVLPSLDAWWKKTIQQTDLSTRCLHTVPLETAIKQKKEDMLGVKHARTKMLNNKLASLNVANLHQQTTTVRPHWDTQNLQ